jgi:hypothetical protein
METVTVFVYVVVGVLFAPMIWLLWFGLDELIRPVRPRSAR